MVNSPSAVCKLALSWLLEGTMPTTACLHDENKKLACFLCLNRGSRALSHREKSCLRDNVYKDFFTNGAFLPGSLCSGCRAQLSSLAGDKPRPLPPPVLYSDLVLEMKFHVPWTRAAADHGGCDCSICKIISSKASWQQISRGQQSRQAMDPEHGSSETSSLIAVCSECLSEIGWGKNHRCNNNSLLENLNKKLTPCTCEKLSAMRICEKVQETGAQKLSLKSTKGHPLQVITGPPVKRQLAFHQSTPASTLTVSHSALSRGYTELNLNMRKMLGLAKIVREECGPQAVAPNFCQKLFAQGHTLESFFNVEELTFSRQNEVKGESEAIQHPVVYCNDINELVQFICEKWDVSTRSLKLGIDRGGGFIKVALSIESLISCWKHSSDTNWVSQEKEAFQGKTHCRRRTCWSDVRIGCVRVNCLYE